MTAANSTAAITPNRVLSATIVVATTDADIAANANAATTGNMAITEMVNIKPAAGIAAGATTDRS